MSRYIDAEKLKVEMMRIGNNAQMKHLIIETYIDNAPTEDVKPIDRGEWIIDKHNRVAKCSVCKKISPYDYGDFCKWCGADMRK